MLELEWLAGKHAQTRTTSVGMKCLSQQCTHERCVVRERPRSRFQSNVLHCLLHRCAKAPNVQMSFVAAERRSRRWSEVEVRLRVLVRKKPHISITPSS
jgi:hypothetical protein